ncbi:MAG: LacI family transcriptional regulator, partial [Gemmatimonadota bacterium]|nr:LacI family transcriptional regulator [Gemmatimonadota bacterium]
MSRLAKVSPATVSRVLTGNASVAQLTKERVLLAMQELGYTPNVFARSLATNRSYSVGVIVNDLSSPYFGSLLRGIENAVEAAGMQLVVASGHTRRESERKAVELLQQRRPDALIVHLEETPDEDLVRWASATTPLVLVGRYVAELEHVSVHLDNELGGFLATQYLISRGHTRIAHLSGPLKLADSRARLAGYRRALEEAALVVDEHLVIEGDFQEDGGQRAAQKLLELHELNPKSNLKETVTAIFAANDQMAAGVLRHLRERGLRVPHDVSLIGYDDIIFARYVHPELTTVRQPLEE